MKSIFNQSEQQEIVSRIYKLSENSSPHWGKMTAGQMCLHCATVLDVHAGVIKEDKPPFFVKLLRPMMRKVIFGDKAYPKNSPTSSQFKMLEETDFHSGKQKLLDSLDYFTNPENKEKIIEHPSRVFGKLTEEEKGWAQYKHINHHLKQFGV